MFSKRVWPIALAAAWALIFGPKIIAYLPLWVLGAVTYEYICRGPSQRRVPLGAAVWVGSLVAYLILVKLHAHGAVLSMFHPKGVRHLVVSVAYYSAIGMFTAANIVGADMLIGNGNAGDRLKRFLAWLAGGSFTLYATHLPLVRLVSAVWPGEAARPSTAILAMLGVTAGAYLLALPGERQKRMYRRWVAKVLRPPTRAKI